MTKLLMIGIDGLDKLMLSKFRNDLPNFTKLAAKSPDFNYTSVFPPDTMPAWISIYTGLNPAKHGVINFVDSRNKKAKVIIDSVENTAFRGKTFWDISSVAKKKVCIVLPYAVYPAYPLNGTIVCRTLKVVPENFPASTYPASLLDDCGLTNFKLNLFHGLPSRKSLSKFSESCRMRTMTEAEIGLKLLRTQPCDLFFIYMSALDAIQHTFWSYCDETHPDYPGPNAFKSIIKDFYVLFDKVVGDFVNAGGQKAVIMVLSDHGHGRRPLKVVNVNEVLRRRGYLAPSAKRLKNTNPFHKTETLKSEAVRLVNRFGIGFFTLRLMHKFPLWKRIFTSPSFIDWEKTLAYVSDLSAIKCYPYCGIMINRKTLTNAAYETLRSQIIEALNNLVDFECGQRLINWCCRREDLYVGDYLSRYPDILVELNDDYGAGWSIGGQIKGMNASRGIQPGSHKAHSPVFLISNLDPQFRIRRDVTLMDVCPTVLDLLGIKQLFKFDGTTILQSV